MRNESIDRCPICLGELKSRKVEKLIKGRNDIASVKVEVDVCLKCGERLYTKEDIQRFEIIRKKLIENDISSMQLIGRSERDGEDTEVIFEEVSRSGKKVKRKIDAQKAYNSQMEDRNK